MSWSWTVFLIITCSNQHPSLSSALNLKFKTLKEMLKIYAAAYGGVASDSKKTSRKPGVGRELFTYRGLGNFVPFAWYFHCGITGSSLWHYFIPNSE